MNYLSNAATRGVGPHRKIVAWKTALALYGRFLTLQFRPSFSKLDEFFSTPWVDCIWTFQPALWSKNATVVCGDKFLPWLTVIQALEYIELHRTKSLGLLFPASFQPWRRLALLWLQMNPGSSTHSHPIIRTHDTLASQVFSVQMDSAEPLLPQHGGGLDIMAQILQQRRNFEYSRWLLTIFIISFFVYCMICPLVLLVTIFVSPWFFHTFKLAANAIWVLIFLVEAWSSVRTTSIPLALPISTGHRAIFEEIYRRHVSDPKDKHFAILGLMDSGKSEPHQPPLKLSSSLESVYRQLSREIIKTSKSLEILLYNTAPSALANPTWVVDWQTASDKWVKSRWYMAGEGKFGAGFFVRSILFNWTTGILDERTGTMPSARPQIKLDRETKHLVVRGLVFSHKFDFLSAELVPITTSTSPSALEESVDAIKRAIDGLGTTVVGDFFLCQLRWFASTSQPLGSGPPPGHYFFLSLLGCLLRRGGAILSALRSALPCFPQREAATAADAIRGLWGPTENGDQPMSASAARKVHEQVTGFLAREDMRLVRFRYRGGTSHCGVAPGAAVVGDAVVLVAGVPMLLVLRAVDDGDRYQVVGPLFTSGFGNGEMERLFRRNGQSMDNEGEEIVLC